MAKQIVPITQVGKIKLVDVKYAAYPVYFAESRVKTPLPEKYIVSYCGSSSGFYGSDGNALEEERYEDALEEYVNKDNGLTRPLQMWKYQHSLEDWKRVLWYFLHSRTNTRWYNLRFNRTVYELYRWLTEKCSTNEGYAELFPDRTIEKLGCTEEQLIVERMNRVTMWWIGVKEYLPKAGLYEYNFLLTESLGIPLPNHFRSQLKRFLKRNPFWGYEGLINGGIKTLDIFSKDFPKETESQDLDKAWGNFHTALQSLGPMDLLQNSISMSSYQNSEYMSS